VRLSFVEFDFSITFTPEERERKHIPREAQVNQIIQ